MQPHACVSLVSFAVAGSGVPLIIKPTSSSPPAPFSSSVLFHRSYPPPHSLLLSPPQYSFTAVIPHRTLLLMDPS
ncbi:hypothetical protein BT69DRAFT_1277518 [Atractiella rhizophila]|nr:hypothetical protein BT69DRAFT_1277518 [Atractiella rhizophila]